MWEESYSENDLIKIYKIKIQYNIKWYYFIMDVFSCLLIIEMRPAQVGVVYSQGVRGVLGTVHTQCTLDCTVEAWISVSV